jgi:hypothetical protein
MRRAIKKRRNIAPVSIPAEPLPLPMIEKVYKLDDLMRGITEDNIHEAIDFGRPEGKEVWPKT